MVVVLAVSRTTRGGAAPGRRTTVVRCGMEGGEEGKKEGQRRTSRASGPCRPRRWDLGRCRVRKGPSRRAEGREGTRVSLLEFGGRDTARGVRDSLRGRDGVSIGRMRWGYGAGLTVDRRRQDVRKARRNLGLQVRDDQIRRQLFQSYAFPRQKTREDSPARGRPSDPS